LLTIETANLEKGISKSLKHKNSFKQKKNSQSIYDWLSAIYDIQNF